MAVFLFAIVFGASHARAEEASACSQALLGSTAVPERAQHTIANLAPALARLSAIETQCLRTAAFYRLRAQLRQSAGQPHLALEDTERALLLDPDSPGTQLDHALLLLAVGDRMSASDLLASLAARADVPNHLMGPMAGLQQQLAVWHSGIADALSVAKGTADAVAPSAQRSRWQIAHSVGRDSNINRAPGGAELTLTLPSGDASFALGDDSLPKPSVLMQTQLQWQGLRTQGVAVWHAQAELRRRQTPNAVSRFTQAEVGLNWLQNPQASRQWVWQTHASGSLSAQQAAYRAVRTGVQHQWQGGACSLSAGGEVERRQHPGAELQNGRYWGFVGGLACGAWQWQWRQGNDNPHAARPGGQYAQQDSRLVWRGQAGVHGWVLEYRWQRQTDEQGYSPLLANNAARRVHRQAVQVEWFAPAPFLAAQAQAFAQLEWSRQRSNLPLFAYSHHRVQVGLRWVVD